MKPATAVILGIAILLVGCAEDQVDGSRLSSSPTTSTPIDEFITHDRIPFTDLLVLDVLQPGGEGSWPVAVLVHGGGWVGGERADLAQLAGYLADNQVLVYNISYRTIALGGIFPDPYEDIACGVAYARATADQYFGDPSNVTLVGYSAGAHLGAAVALAGDEFRGDCLSTESGQPDRFVGIAGPYDSDQFSPLLIPFFGGIRAEASDAWNAGNPYTYVDQMLGMPIHLFHGTADQTVPEQFTLDFSEALQTAGHDVQLTVLPGAGHRDLVDPAQNGPAIVEAMRGLDP